jgi:hypothetical protein
MMSWDQVGCGECTPFVGAGACAGVLPLAKQLAEDLITEDELETHRQCPLPDRTDLARVCSAAVFVQELLDSTKSHSVLE